MEKEKLVDLLDYYLSDLKAKLNELEMHYKAKNYKMVEIVDEVICNLHDNISYVIKQLNKNVD